MAEEHEAVSSTFGHSSQQPCKGMEMHKSTAQHGAEQANSFSHASQQPYSGMDVHKSTPHNSAEQTNSSNSSAADQVLKLANVTSTEDQNNLVFIANAINHLDRLTTSLNKQNSLVQNLQQMFPPIVAPGNGNTDSGQSRLSQDMSPGPTSAEQVAPPQGSQDANRFLQQSNVSFANSLPLTEETHFQAGLDETNQKHLHGFERDLHCTTNGRVSRKQRYRKTHDVLKQSGLLDIARKTSILLKHSAQLDQHIAAFKSLVNDHCRKIMSESENHRLLAPVEVKSMENISHQSRLHSERTNECS